MPVFLVLTSYVCLKLNILTRIFVCALVWWVTSKAKAGFLDMPKGKD